MQETQEYGIVNTIDNEAITVSFYSNQRGLKPVVSLRQDNSLPLVRLCKDQIIIDIYSIDDWDRILLEFLKKYNFVFPFVFSTFNLGKGLVYTFETTRVAVYKEDAQVEKDIPLFEVVYYDDKCKDDVNLVFKAFLSAWE